MVSEIKQKEFCRLTGLTRKALLLYEDKEILLPYRIDPDTSYRYYNEENLFLGQKIAFLRSLHFSISEITELINDSGNSNTIIAHKELELRREFAHINNGLNFISLNNGYPLPFSDELREVVLPLRLVAVIEGRGDSREVALAHKLLLRQTTLDAALIIGDPATFYFKDSSPELLHFKAILSISAAPYAITGSYQVEHFGSPRFTFLRNYGNYELLSGRYRELLNRMSEQGVQKTGEYLEIYRNTLHSTVDSTTLITDIGVPQWV